MIYVDRLKSCSSNSSWKWNKFCHLFADTLSELHGFAEKLGLKRSWFQMRKSFPHYDLIENKRKEAVSKGAIEIKNILELLKRI